MQPVYQQFALPFDSCFFVWDWVFAFLIALLQLQHIHGVERSNLLTVGMWAFEQSMLQ